MKTQIGGEGLKRLWRMGRNSDFTFHFGSYSISCCTEIAVFVSKKASKCLAEDSYTKMVVCQKSMNKSQFEVMRALFMGEEVEIPVSETNFWIHVAFELGIDDLLDLLVNSSLNSGKSIILKLINKINNQLDPTEELNEVSRSFKDIPIDDFTFLNLESLFSILKNPNMPPINEEEKFDFIHQIVEKKGKEYFSLYSLVEFMKLKSLQMQKFIPQFMSVRAPLEVIQAVSQRLLQPISQPIQTQIMKKANINRVYTSGNEFNGVFKALYGLINGNPHDHGLLKITMSTYVMRPPQLLLEPTNDDSVYSDSRFPNQWLCINMFSQFTIRHYSIKTFHGKEKRAHMKSWVLEASDNGSDWIIIDQRKDTNDLNGTYKWAVFSASPQKSFAMYRIRLTDKNHRGDHELLLARLEFFGAYEIDG